MSTFIVAVRRADQANDVGSAFFGGFRSRDRAFAFADAVEARRPELCAEVRLLRAPSGTWVDAWFGPVAPTSGETAQTADS